MSQEQEQEATRLEDLLKKQEEATRKLEEHNKKLLDMASKDPLTGLDNRRIFNRSMDTEIDRVKRYGEAFSLLVVDVDHFKRVNDTYGHPAGDKVLKELAARMKTALRDVDQIARLGGEEFGAILPSTSGTGARVAAERLRASVEGQPFSVDGLDLPITVSVGGVTIAKNSDIADADDIFAAADKAMYDAKNKGRNQVRWAKV
jgi:diguanylate cyclase (GGDEF)-like protein